LRLLLANKTGSPVVPLLTGPTPRVLEVIGSLGATLDNRIAPLLLPILVDPARPSDVRSAAVRAVARVNDGADGLLAMAVAGRITDDLRSVVGAELRGARRPAVREQAEKLFPPPLAKEGKALPPIAELTKIPGEARRGAAVFRRVDIGCINCHQVGVEGVDLGPKLTEIGGKLGKEALAEAILDPSAGISFGFEAWTIELKNGDEASGIIASETEEEVVLKTATAATSKHKKTDIAKREKQKLSIMPAGLQQNMTTQDFADLLEYLASLKKPAN
jgi:putative heme-binding domain-containing protein